MLIILLDDLPVSVVNKFTGKFQGQIHHVVG